MKALALLLAFTVVTVHAETVGPWDLDQLFEAPAMRWEDRSQPIHSLIYAGEPVQGRDTEVFAFYASPSTLGKSAEGPFPGVVLIHGGGGTAFAEWVWLWAKRGYAAIAMDLSGRRPPAPTFDADGTPVRNQAAAKDSRARLKKGGLEHTHVEKFDCILTEDTSDDWPFHAAASVIRAHSLLRSLEEVDADRTAVTGISWGGYTTCLAASLDHRFKAAVPVYGCGFLHEGESVQKPSIDKLGDHRDKWVREYDPASLLKHCRVPILFVNGTNDKHYVLDSYQKSFDVLPGSTEKHLRIEVGMRHGHQPGWAPEEIGLFIDSKCREGKPLPVLAEPSVRDGRVTVRVEGQPRVESAQLRFTTDDGPRVDRQWQTVDASIRDGNIAAPAPPNNANTWFLTATDERGAMVSTTVQFQD